MGPRWPVRVGTSAGLRANAAPVGRSRLAAGHPGLLPGEGSNPRNLGGSAGSLKCLLAPARTLRSRQPRWPGSNRIGRRADHVPVKVGRAIFLPNRATLPQGNLAASTAASFASFSAASSSCFWRRLTPSSAPLLDQHARHPAERGSCNAKACRARRSTARPASLRKLSGLQDHAAVKHCIE